MIDEKVKIGIALAVGLGVGGGVGYYVAVRKVRAQASEEVARIQDLYQRLRQEDAEQARLDWSSQPDPSDSEAEGDDGDLSDGIEEYQEKAVDLGYIGSDDYVPGVHKSPDYVGPEPKYPGDEDLQVEDPDLQKEVEYVRSIRIHNPNSDADPNDVTKWERDPNRPYVITVDEFRHDRPDHDKITLTYYAGDDTLAEEDGTYIPDQDGTAGDDNLYNYFGLASGEENLLHIRNERVGCDFEIKLETGTFQREVLGFTPENDTLSKSKATIRKMRPSG